MVSKVLTGVWAFFDFFLLVGGAVTFALSIVWRAPNPLVNLVFSDMDLTGGMILGIAMLITFAFSIGAIIQRNHVTIGLVILNWMLIVDALVVLVIGSIIWFYTLGERDNFHGAFIAASHDMQIAIQDKLQCCGYFFTNDTVITGGFCQSADFAVSHNVTCVGPITAFADTNLTNLFSTVYGFMAIILGLFLATTSVIYKRNEVERFRRIDSKRGGRGFV